MEETAGKHQGKERTRRRSGGIIFKSVNGDVFQRVLETKERGDHVQKKWMRRCVNEEKRRGIKERELVEGTFISTREERRLE